MEFEEFKKKIVEGLRDIYGDRVEIDTGVVIKNNGNKYNGICIRPKNAECRTAPVIELDSLYSSLENGTMKIEDCVWEILHNSANLSGHERVEQLAKDISDWECVKDDIYPILLSTEENRELLEKLVSTSMLDLSVVYIIRRGLSGESTMGIKITPKMLESYGMDVEQLHGQALENMGKDGYEFLELRTLVKEILHMDELDDGQDDHKTEMYILTNSARFYGAAGILNKELLRGFAGDRNFIILPSSVHESLFVPVNNETDQAFFDEMVREVNRSEVSVEEKLADHSYYYDAQIGEIRMCA